MSALCNEGFSPPNTGKDAGMPDTKNSFDATIQRGE